MQPVPFSNPEKAVRDLFLSVPLMPSFTFKRLHNQSLIQQCLIQVVVKQTKSY